MGLLKAFDLSAYGCNVYVETGIGQGRTLSKAIPVFERCFSVDLDSELFKAAQQQFPTATLYNGLSTDALEHWLSSGQLADTDRVLFFLDAHFPNSDFHGAPYDVNSPDAVPLRRELELIQQYRPAGRDYIICDDLRIYCQGPFEEGNCPDIQVPGGLAFLNGLYPWNKITLDYRETGYLLIDLRNE
jgi:hypothetical protein